jgi:hypothetical protein
VRLNVAQQLYDGLQDPLLSEALQTFFEKQQNELREKLLSAVRQHIRDTMKEARIAGMEEAYSECLGEMRRFAEEQLRNASQ